MTQRQDSLDIKVKLAAGWCCGALIVVLSAWVLHSFLQALLAACVTAIASWPLYRRFMAALPRRIAQTSGSLIFTLMIVLFVLGPLMFALGALLTEAHALLLELAAAGEKGIPVPPWLRDMPLAGLWVGLWEGKLAHPGALQVWTQQTDPAGLLSFGQSIGQFMARHIVIITFTILVSFFLYQEGESFAFRFRRVLRHHVGERSDAYVDVATRALRATVNSMLIVGLFDGVAISVVFAIAGVPHFGLWAAITGSLALVPFLGYLAVAALTLQLAMAGAATPALTSFGLGCVVLFCGDKIVRPMVARDGTRLPFAWILMGCLGGFEVLGLAGLVVGPALLTLTRELWQRHIIDTALPNSMD
ncbi:MAG: AI-2E family transporter [Sulfuritalea sp.]|nr:AI-2E family transporter [Sulfuritalea sp.]